MSTAPNEFHLEAPHRVSIFLQLLQYSALKMIVVTSSLSFEKLETNHIKKTGLGKLQFLFTAALNFRLIFICYNTANAIKESAMPSSNTEPKIIYIDLIKENSDVYALFQTYKHSLDSLGNTLLHAASRKNLVNVIEQLIDLGFDVNAQDKDKNCALHSALCYDKIEAALALIRKGIDPNSAWYYTYRIPHNILGYAITCKQNRIVEALIAAKANLDAEDGEGLRPLHVAVKCNNVEAIQILVAAGANTSLKSVKKPASAAPKSLLQIAVDHQHIEALKYLLSLQLKIDQGVWDICFRPRCYERPGELIFTLLIGLLKQDPTHFISELQKIPSLAQRVSSHETKAAVDLNQFVSAMNDANLFNNPIKEIGIQAEDLVNLHNKSSKLSTQMAICASIAFFILLIGLVLIFLGPAALTIAAIAVTAVAACATGVTGSVSGYSFFQKKQVENTFAGIQTDNIEEPQDSYSMA